MIRRVAFLLFLALQVATNASPAAALILCISDDGCASLELVRPGSTRCDEGNCDEPHAGTADHSCRDIPLLSAGKDFTRSNPAPNQTSGNLTLTLAPSLVVDTAGPLQAHVEPLAPPPLLRQIRSVVLTL